ncbi:hypothetical protein J2X28_001649 [Kocuria rhizophila]|uniref:hypothetical protein n=1 Tax=Kocuria rhizophila TaxID=72000 RepID=UPI002863BE86|nr:hypothetical protein [Kocuria rhizophila]MDR7374657.1 hypothetical protein [Kocuria rhizophila]
MENYQNLNKNRSIQDYEALAQLLFLEPEQEMSYRDGMVFGNYLELPSAENISDDDLEEVLEHLGISLPSDAPMRVEGFSQLRILDVVGREQLLDMLGTPDLQFSDDGELFISFPDFTRDTSTLRSILATQLPMTVYEPDLPESMKYYSDVELSLDWEYDLMRQNWEEPVAVEALIEKIELMHEDYLTASSVILRKSVLLACFSLVEAFTRQRAIQNIPLNPSGSPFERHVFKIFEELVSNDVKRKDLVNILEPKKEWRQQIPLWRLRNALAHDIDGVDLNGKKLVYTFKRGRVEKIEAEKIFNDLIDYANKYLR